MTSLPNLRLHIEYLAPEAIKPNPRNPRKHSKKQINQLANSMNLFGCVVPMLINQHNVIISGHGRLLAAKQLGFQEVPVVRLEHLSEEQATALMIADNKLTENSTWDELLLAEHFLDLSTVDLDFSLEVTGFEMGKIDFFIQGLSNFDDEDEDFTKVIDNLPVISQPGYLWQLGDHRIFCGNALEQEVYKALLGEEIVDMIITDPPYNVRIKGHASNRDTAHAEFAMASGEMDKEAFITFLKTVFRLLTQHSRDGSIHYVFMDWRHVKEILAAGTDVYAEVKNLCVWAKENGGMGSLYRSGHELVFVFKHGKAPHVNNVDLGKHGRYRTNVWRYPGETSMRKGRQERLAMHPTVKPLAMIADAILDCSNRNDLILDPFGGSGTTLLAAEKTGRRARLIELEPRYVDVTIRRWQRLTGKRAVHAESGKTFDELSKEMEAHKEVDHA